MVLYGTNDMSQLGGPESVAEFQASYQDMLQQLVSSLPSTKFRCLGMLQRRDYSASDRAPWSAAIQNAVLAVYSPNVQFIPVEGWIDDSADSPDLFDNVRPNPTGYQKIENRLLPYVSSWPVRVLDRSRRSIQGAGVHLFDIDLGSLLPATATTDAHGAYCLQIGDNPTGRYDIGAYASGYNQWTFSPNFQGWQVTGDDMTPTEIVLDSVGTRTGGVFGFVRYDDATGAHPIGAGVHINIYAGGHLIVSTDSNANGQYSVQDLPAISNWWGWYSYVATGNGHKAVGVNFGVWGGVPICMDIAFKV